MNCISILVIISAFDKKTGTLKMTLRNDKVECPSNEFITNVSLWKSHKMQTRESKIELTKILRPWRPLTSSGGGKDEDIFRLFFKEGRSAAYFFTCTADWRCVPALHTSTPKIVWKCPKERLSRLFLFFHVNDFVFVICLLLSKSSHMIVRNAKMFKDGVTDKTTKKC